MPSTNKTAAEYLALYAAGWTEGDLQKVLEATGPQFVFYEPTNEVPKYAFPQYFAEFKAANAPFSPDKFMNIEAVASRVVGGRLTAACFWETGSFMGTGLIVATRTGVQFEAVQLVTL